MLRAIFPGSFDPPTVGHLDLIERSLAFCDELFVVIAQNPLRHSFLFSAEERIQLFQELKLSSKVKVTVWEGLLVDYAQEVKASLIIRGVRTLQEWENEYPRAWIQRELSSIETIFLPVSPKYSGVSSSLVRELGQFSPDLKGLVPKAIEERVFKRCQK